jgi:hypothetical protein
MDRNFIASELVQAARELTAGGVRKTYEVTEQGGTESISIKWEIHLSGAYGTVDKLSEAISELLSTATKDARKAGVRGAPQFTYIPKNGLLLRAHLVGELHKIKNGKYIEDNFSNTGKVLDMMSLLLGDD